MGCCWVTFPTTNQYWQPIINGPGRKENMLPNLASDFHSSTMHSNSVKVIIRFTTRDIQMQSKCLILTRKAPRTPQVSRSLSVLALASSRKSSINLTDCKKKKSSKRKQNSSDYFLIQLLLESSDVWGDNWILYTRLQSMTIQTQGIPSACMSYLYLYPFVQIAWFLYWA